MSKELIDALKCCLACTFSEYTHAHGFHWNVTGPNFAELHDFFGDVYEDVYSAIDPLAENIRKMGAPAPFRMTELSSLSRVREVNPKGGPAMLAALLRINDKTLGCLQDAYGIANQGNEYAGIANFLAERIDMHQKWRWQIRSFME